MICGGGSKVVATLKADGQVYPVAERKEPLFLANYKIRIEGEIGGKTLNTLGVATTVMDLGKQLLQYARDGDKEGVQNMIVRGAPFTSDWLGMSALHFAVMNNQYEICELLLKGGINKDAKTKVDRTPLHFACQCGHDRIVELLIFKKCAINPRDMLHMTPLHWAVDKKFKNIVRILLSHNADVSCVTKFGKTAFALAVQSEQADVIEMLEAAKQTQLRRKRKAEIEKALKVKRETSDAINSIIDLGDGPVGDFSMPELMYEDFVKDLPAPSGKASQSKAGKSNSKTGYNSFDDKSAVNLLKSHGISMLQDEVDPARNLLNSALQNGRQLVLSEGGKWLLNGAPNRKLYGTSPRSCTVTSKTGSATATIDTINVDSDSESSNNNNSRKRSRIVPSAAVPPLQKLPRTEIMKAKEGLEEKEVKIISAKEAQQGFPKAQSSVQMQKIPLVTPRVTRQIAEDGRIFDFIECKAVLNNKKVQTRQMPTKYNEPFNAENLIIEDPVSDYAELASSKNNTATAAPRATASATEKQYIKLIRTPMRVVAKKVAAPGAFSPALQVRQVSSVKPPPLTSTVKKTAAASDGNDGQKKPCIMPLLSHSEICRQLYELRRQNEELRRRMDLMAKEKDVMAQRLSRIENLLLGQKASSRVS